MNRKILAFVLAAPACLWGASIPPFDAFKDFSNTSNPGSIWAYGYHNTLQNLNQGENFVLYGRHLTGCPAGVQCWSVSETQSTPAAWKNTTGAPIVAGAITIPADKLYLHPYYYGYYSTVRFTAPEDALYEVSYAFQRSTTDTRGDGTQFVIVRNNEPGLLFDRSISAKDSSLYSGVLTMNLRAGDRLYFGVGPRGDGAFDSSAFNAAIRPVPEPGAGAYGAAVAATLIAAVAARRRSPRRARCA